MGKVEHNLARSVRATGRPTRLLAGLAAGLGALGLVGAPPSAAGTLRAAPARVGAAPVVPPGARALGALDPATRLQVTVALQSSHPAQLAALATAVSTPGNPQYRRPLSEAAFVARFAPSVGQVAQVRSALRSVGLNPGAVTADHLAVGAVATAGQLARAFHVSFERYSVGGRVAYASRTAPLLPGAVAPLVQSVVGLDDLTLPRPLSEARPATPGLSGMAGSGPAGATRTRPGATTGGPQPCAAATESTVDGGYTIDSLASAYGFAGLYQAGDEGAGQSIAVYELESDLPSDIADFQACYGTDTAISDVAVDGGPSATGAGSGESAIDIEDVIGLAPKASLQVFQGPLTNPGAYDTYNAIVSRDNTTAVVTGWGACEANSGAVYKAESTLFEEAAVQGQSIVAAAGDAGSEDCYDSSNPATGLAVDDPAGQPFVTGVGGTSLDVPGPRPTETVWNTRIGAGGGGNSADFAMPGYQTAAPASLHVINASSSGTPCTAGAGDYCREVPDVTADADPSTGTLVVHAGQWSLYGGASVGADIWVSLLALTDDEGACHGAAVGFANPALYDVAGGSGYGTDFNDVTSGNNDFTDSNGGQYSAGPGYDLASGLGSPNGSSLAGALCSARPPPSIVSISPQSGSTAGLTTVTIDGTGLSGASAVDFGSAAATITSNSATQLTVVSPPGSAGPAVAVTVHTAAGTAADPGAFTYFTPPAPTVTGLTPNQGPTAGQTEITVSGTNLESATAVDFGLAPATLVSDPDSGNQLVAVSPAQGAGTVDVSVTTAGGTVTDDSVFTYVSPQADPYTPLVPLRICDTRPGNPSQLSGAQAQCDGAADAGEPLAPGVPLAVTVQDPSDFGVPADATAVVLNVTAISTTTSGYVSVFPTDQVPPTASNLNFTAGKVVPNLVEAGIGAQGSVSLVSNAAVNVAVDLEGYVAPSADSGAGLYNPLSSPARICDTRAANPSGLTGGATQCGGHTLSAGAPLGVQVSGLGGVPASGVSAVVLNVTAVGPSGQGYLSVYPAGSTAPTASNVNFTAGQTVANRVVVPVSSDGGIDVVASRATDAIVDVSGWYSAGGGAGEQFQALPAPLRVCDTRAGNPSGLSGDQAQCNGNSNVGRTLGPAASLTITVSGILGIPSGVGAVVLNVTAIHPSNQTFVSVFPGPTRPGVSDLNPAPGSVKANLVVATVSSGGQVTIYNNAGTVDVAVDVAGYFAATP